LYTCEGDTNAEWVQKSDGTLVNVRSGSCFDDPSATTANGTQLQIWACDGLVQQNWNLP
jgi:beta-glucosidase